MLTFVFFVDHGRCTNVDCRRPTCSSGYRSRSLSEAAKIARESADMIQFNTKWVPTHTHPYLLNQSIFYCSLQHDPTGPYYLTSRKRDITSPGAHLYHIPLAFPSLSQSQSLNLHRSMTRHGPPGCVAAHQVSCLEQRA